MNWIKDSFFKPCQIELPYMYYGIHRGVSGYKGPLFKVRLPNGSEADIHTWYGSFKDIEKAGCKMLLYYDQAGSDKTLNFNHIDCEDKITES